MDGLDEYLNDPYEWAVLVVLDHIDSEEKSKQNEKFVNKLLDEGIYKFISSNFLEFDLPKPSKEKIVSEVMMCFLGKE